MHPYLAPTYRSRFAHRGGASDAPENTVPAFAAAVALGYRYLETDVHVTVDGVLVAFHDDDLTRTCGVAGRISELPWSEVATARVDGQAPIPTMDELFETWPDARWNIDCKSDGAVAPLADAVRRHAALDRVCVASFSDRRIRDLRRRLGRDLCTAAGHVGARRCCGRPGSGSATHVPRRCRPARAGSMSSPRGSCVGPTAEGWSCTCGRSTIRPRCTACSTSESTG